MLARGSQGIARCLVGERKEKSQFSACKRDPERRLRARFPARPARPSRLRRSNAPPPWFPPLLLLRGLVSAEKLAPTAAAAFIVNMQLGCIPLHAPDQPEKVLVNEGFALRVTDTPLASGSTQAGVQSITPSLELTYPCPDPVTLTVNCNEGTKFAVTDWEAFMTTVQPVIAPPQAPAQEEK
jgi:hypothetical protein